jgi:hypothetical protein
VENGGPVQGTWTGPLEGVDLLVIRRSLPCSLRDSRVKEWESFIIQADCFFLEAPVANAKFYRAAWGFFYNKESRKKLKYLRVVSFGGWRLSPNLHNFFIDSHFRKFFFEFIPGRMPILSEGIYISKLINGGLSLQPT